MESSLKKPQCYYTGRHEWREIANQELLNGKMKRFFRCIYCFITVSTEKKMI